MAQTRSHPKRYSVNHYTNQVAVSFLDPECPRSSLEKTLLGFVFCFGTVSWCFLIPTLNPDADSPGQQIDDLVILSVLQILDVHGDSSPIEVQRVDALYDFFLKCLRTRASQAVQYFGGDILDQNANFLCEDGTSSMQDVLPTTAQHSDVAVSEIENYFPIGKSHGHSEREFVRAEAVRNVVAATRCAVFVFKRVYCKPLPASGMDRVAGMVADWFSLHERLIFQSVIQSVSENKRNQFSWRRCPSEQVWDSLEADSWALLRSEWEQYCWEIQGNAFAFSEGWCSQDIVSTHAGFLWSCGADYEDHHRVCRKLRRASKLVPRHPRRVQMIAAIGLPFLITKLDTTICLRFTKKLRASFPCKKSL